MRNISLLVQGNLGVRALELHPPEDDLRRAARFVKPDDRARSLLAADLLRHAASELTGTADVAVGRHCRGCGEDGDHGRPVVRGVPGAELSASHAGGVVVVVGSTSSRVGVDVEVVEHTSFPGFDATALTPGERSRVVDAEDPGLERARLWTSKEAVLKWTGWGLALDPAGLEIGGDGRVRALGPEIAAELSEDLVVVDLLGLPPGHVGSVAANALAVPALARPRAAERAVLS